MSRQMSCVVLRETTSRGQCERELVCPSRTNERGGEGTMCSRAGNFCFLDNQGDDVSDRIFFQYNPTKPGPKRRVFFSGKKILVCFCIVPLTSFRSLCVVTMPRKIRSELESSEVFDITVQKELTDYRLLVMYTICSSGKDHLTILQPGADRSFAMLGMRVVAQAGVRMAGIRPGAVGIRPSPNGSDGSALSAEPNVSVCGSSQRPHVLCLALSQHHRRGKE
jgi:hypothetical protein